MRNNKYVYLFCSILLLLVICLAIRHFLIIQSPTINNHAFKNEIKRGNFTSKKYITIKNTDKHYYDNLRKLNIDTDIIEIPMVDNMIIADHTICNNTVYYVVTDNVKSDFHTKFKIYKFDIKTAESYDIFQMNDIKKPSYISEIHANANFLFWEVVDSNYNWKIYKLDLNDLSADIIRCSDDLNNSLIEPIMTISDNYLAWYESIGTSGDNYEERIVLYDINKNILEILDNEVDLDGNPYKRPYLMNNKLTYIDRDEDEYIIKIYDLNSQETDILLPGTKLACVLSNGNITVWMDDYYNSNVYVYDHTLKKLNLIEKEQSILSVDIINNDLLITYIKDNSYSNIYYLDLSSNIKINLTNSKTNVVYCLPRHDVNYNSIYKISKVDKHRYFVVTNGS
ncbi:hypothetical protein [Brassicibacter mesophilus]|uniref:hypothetical protein n=1 Tax=Brassicibacter mesophilus TaxID=745119 RepID=UPI003D1B0E0E